MHGVVETEGRIGDPIGAMESGDFGSSDLDVGRSLIVLGADYEMRVTGAEPEETPGVYSIEPVHSLLGNLFIHGTAAAVSDKKGHHASVEWFTSMSELDTTMTEFGVNPHAFSLGIARFAAEYDSAVRRSHLASPVRSSSNTLLVPGIDTRFVEARTDGVLPGALLAPEGVKSAIAEKASRAFGENGNKSSGFMRRVSTICSGLSLAMDGITVEQLACAKTLSGLTQALNLSFDLTDAMNDFFDTPSDEALERNDLALDVALQLVSCHPNLLNAQRSKPSIDELRAQLPSA